MRGKKAWDVGFGAGIKSPLGTIKGIAFKGFVNTQKLYVKYFRGANELFIFSPGKRANGFYQK